MDSELWTALSTVCGTKTYSAVSALKLHIARVFEAAGTRIFKNRLFGGLRGRKGREMSRLAIFRGNKKTAVGRGVRIRV